MPNRIKDKLMREKCFWESATKTCGWSFMSLSLSWRVYWILDVITKVLKDVGKQNSIIHCVLSFGTGPSVTFINSCYEQWPRYVSLLSQCSYSQKTCVETRCTSTTLIHALNDHTPKFTGLTSTDTMVLPHPNQDVWSLISGLPWLLDQVLRWSNILVCWSRN